MAEKEQKKENPQQRKRFKEQKILNLLTTRVVAEEGNFLQSIENGRERTKKRKSAAAEEI